MEFNFPPGFNTLPPEIQENIKSGMIQQYIFNMHLGDEYFKSLLIICNMVEKFTAKEKYKDDSDVRELEKMSRRSQIMLKNKWKCLLIMNKLNG